MKNEYFEKQLELEAKLLETIQEKQTELLKMKEWADNQFGGGEDMVYRFYHQSFKVYRVQEWTGKMVELIRSLLPVELNSYFERIVEEGTGKVFKMDHNTKWYEETKPLIDTYLHTRHILDLIVKYGINGTENDRTGDPGWYTVLYIYKIR